MNPANESIPLTTKKKVLFYAISILIVLVAIVVGAEILLRSAGFRPWNSVANPIQVEPGGTFYRAHPTLGYSSIPGDFTVTLHTGYSFHVTHLPNTLRITRPIERYDEEPPGDAMWIFGCSITHGWSLNDEETYSWVLQEKFPDYDVVNFGVDGYGTIHSLMQFREALETKTPKVAVLAYGGFHDERNTFSRQRRKQIVPFNKLGPVSQAYARLNDRGELQYFLGDGEYTEFPLMRHLALSNFLEMKYDQLEIEWLRSHEVSEALILEMAALAETYGVKFIVANIGAGLPILAFAEKNGISNVNLEVDFNLPENRNLPHDGHPSAIANKKYANRLEKHLRAELAK